MYSRGKKTAGNRSDNLLSTPIHPRKPVKYRPSYSAGGQNPYSKGQVFHSSTNAGSGGVRTLFRASGSKSETPSPIARTQPAEGLLDAFLKQTRFPHRAPKPIPNRAGWMPTCVLPSPPTAGNHRSRASLPILCTIEACQHAGTPSAPCRQAVERRGKARL